MPFTPRLMLCAHDVKTMRYADAAADGDDDAARSCLKDTAY